MMRFGKRGLNLAANAAVTAATKVSCVSAMDMCLNCFECRFLQIGSGSDWNAVYHWCYIVFQKLLPWPTEITCCSSHHTEFYQQQIMLIFTPPKFSGVIHEMVCLVLSNPVVACFMQFVNSASALFHQWSLIFDYLFSHTHGHWLQIWYFSWWVKYIKITTRGNFLMLQVTTCVLQIW